MPVGSGRYPSGQRGQTVNLLASAFGGSNPPLPTTVTNDARPALAVSGLSWERMATTCGNSSAVERQPSKLGVAGSNPVSRSRGLSRSATAVPGRSERLRVWGRLRGPHENGSAHVAQLAERVLGKDEVSGSIPDMGSIVVGQTFRTVNGR
jgi:hypothetical protein